MPDVDDIWDDEEDMAQFHRAQQDRVVMGLDVARGPSRSVSVFSGSRAQLLNALREMARREKRGQESAILQEAIRVIAELGEE